MRKSRKRKNALEAELLDEAFDLKTVAAVLQGRVAIRKGCKGIPVSRLFSAIRKAKT